MSDSTYILTALLSTVVAGAGFMFHKKIITNLKNQNIQVITNLKSQQSKTINTLQKQVKWSKNINKYNPHVKRLIRKHGRRAVLGRNY